MESHCRKQKPNKVSLNMAKYLLSKETKKNVVFSPLSLQIMLSILAAGSNGPTQQELLSFLKFESTKHLNSFASKIVSDVLSDGAPTGGPLLSFANGGWIEQSLSLQPSFKQIVATDYKATIESVDFQNNAAKVTKEVNSWVAKETNGLIKELIPSGSVNNSTKLIFANALYFKGTWKDKFDAKKTKHFKFHLLNGGSVKVPFMTSKEKQFIRAFDDFKVLGLPYKQGRDKRQFSMYIFLPNANKGLSALVEKLASDSKLIAHQLPREKVAVGNFWIPKFNFSFGLETSNMLKKLGVVLPFSEGADLTKMVDSREDLYVSDLFHKSFIKVDEEGTKVVAATGMIIVSKGMCISTRLDFVADHPFLFIIRENSTGTIIFVGQVLNPLVE